MESKGITLDEGGGVKEGEMSILPKRDSPNFQSHLNTIILVFGVATGLISVGILYQTQVSNDRDVQSWITRHEAQHRERQSLYEGTIATIRAELGQTREETRKLENLTYRITVAETTAINIQKSLESLAAALATLAADVRVTRTIIEAEGPPVVPRRRGQRVDN